MAVEAIQDFGTGGSPSKTVTGTGQTVTLTSSWAPFALTFSIPSITGKTLGTNSNDYFGLLFWTSAGSDFNARTNSLGLQTIGVDLWGVHIKVGTHTTAATDLYKQPELGPELARCQRYYASWGGASGYDRIGIGQCTSATGGVITVVPPVVMRATPALTTTGALLLTSSILGALSATSITLDSGGSAPRAASINVNVASGLTAGHATLLATNNSTAARLALDAEL
jgi:hypothetical protein